MSRQTFSDFEKTCLQELIVKYKLNSSATIGAGNPAAKKMAWVRLTQEFNSIETNSKRTEAQLKKCWDNLKTRRKQTLALEKRERMRTGGGVCVPSTSRDSQQVIDAALLDATDIELTYVIDSDMVTVDLETEQNLSVPTVPIPDPAPAAALDDGQMPQIQEPITVRPSAGSRLSDYVAPSRRASTPVAADVEDAPRRPSGGSRLSTYAAPSQATVPKNIRAHVINEEFGLRKEKNRQVRERDEELHQLKITEQEWLIKAAEEIYNKARLERQSAEELVLCNRAKRELAEMELAKARK